MQRTHQPQRGDRSGLFASTSSSSPTCSSRSPRVARPAFGTICRTLSLGMRQLPDLRAGPGRMCSPGSQSKTAWTSSTLSVRKLRVSDRISLSSLTNRRRRYPRKVLIPLYAPNRIRDPIVGPAPPRKTPAVSRDLTAGEPFTGLTLLTQGCSHEDLHSGATRETLIFSRRVGRGCWVLQSVFGRMDHAW